MERRRFGSTGTGCRGDRPGHLVPRQRRPRRRGRRAAPGPRSRHDPHRHRRDVRRAPRRSSPRRSPGGATRSSWSPRSCPRTPRGRGTIAACERSLARLETDRLDCYLLHWRGRHPLEDTFAAFEQLRQRREDPLLGREQLRRATTSRRPAQIAGEGRIACNQVLYHLEERAIEHAVLPWCEEHGVAVVAYSPFGHGRLSRPAHQGRPRAAGDRRGARRDPAPGRAPVPGAAALALRDPQGLPARARGGERGSRRSRLTEAELARIDEAFPLGPRPRELPML